MAPDALQQDTTSMWPEIKAAAADAMPLIIAVAPFAAVFGALANEAGLSLFEIMLVSGTIFAGASQYAMLELMGQNVAPWAIVLTVFAINFRHVLYSASIGRYLGRYTFTQKIIAFFLLTDLQYAVAETRLRKTSLRPAYYFAFGLILYVSWMVSNFVGALFGRLLEDPAQFGFDFILPIYFTGLVLGFRGNNNFLPILLTSGAVSLLAWQLVGTPWHITIGGVAGLLIAAVLSKPKDAEEAIG